jgi:hypothetical protein
MLNWLTGIPAKQITGNIYEIKINGYGPADVGPYMELQKYLKGKRGSSNLEAHHIVAVEHLNMIRTRYSKNDAPSVAIPQSLHRSIMSSRITGEQRYLGGRPKGGKVAASKSEVLDLYKQIYTWHTKFHELFDISRRIIGS